MQERRRFVRLNIPLEVDYQIAGRQDGFARSVTKDISPNGARFLVKEELPKGSILLICLKLPPALEVIQIKARAVWSKKEGVEQQHIFDTGFEFVEISEKDKKLFFQYMCNLMYNQLKHVSASLR